jgi:hypothetical protein
MRVIHLFCCLSAICLWIASSDSCLPVASAQPPAENGANDGSSIRLRPLEDNLPPVARQTPTVESLEADPAADSRSPAATNQPARRIAAVVHGVRVFLPKKIDEISVDIRQGDNIPLDLATGAFQAVEKDPSRDETWVPRQFMWQASEFWHRPLYFDDVPLERYGQMHHPLVQPILSGAHFFGNIPLLPYKMGIDRPCDEIATLGYYRPGSAAPAVGRRLPLEADAASIEAATWIGLILLLP